MCNTVVLLPAAPNELTPVPNQELISAKQNSTVPDAIKEKCLMEQINDLSPLKDKNKWLVFEQDSVCMRFVTYNMLNILCGKYPENFSNPANSSDIPLPVVGFQSCVHTCVVGYIEVV